MIRCPHCGLLHVSSRSVCPTTGLTISGVEPRSERAPDRRGRLGTLRPKSQPAKLPALQSIIEGKYRLLAVIGQGGMGTVFEAIHVKTGRKVAIKVLKPEHLEKKEAVVRMRHEARVVSQIGHPNICEILDLGQLPTGVPFLVMERLEGETLAGDIEKRGWIEHGEMVEISLQVLAALEAAHRHGVVHRDMKPDNIFLTQRSQGLVSKILDFGISKAMVGLEDTAHSLTRPGMVMGTPYYMAPEQAMGERTLDGRVDIWGLGVVMYEALSGRRPFVAKNYNALLVQILTIQPPMVHEVNAKVPFGLAQVVQRMLEKRREARFASAQELRTALARFRVERPPVAKTFIPPANERGLPVFGTPEDSSSSFTASDEEPTQEIDKPERSEDDTPTVEEHEENTIVDVPSSILEHETTEQRRRR